MNQPMPRWIQHKISDLIGGELLEIGDGFRAKNSEMAQTGLPFARAGNINNGFDFEDADLLGEKSVAQVGNKISRPDDSVITTKGTFGRVAYVRPGTPRFVYSPQLCYWRVKNSSVIQPRFVYYWLQGPNFLSQAFQIKSSTDMADYASLTDQRRMLITAPNVETQKQIAAILSAYDELIENNQRRIALLEKMAEEIYREWFVRLRFPGHEKAKFVKGVPADWEFSTINRFVEFQSGYSFKSEKYVSNGQFGIVTIKNVHDGFFVPKCSDFIDKIPSNIKKHCFLQAGDMLMSLTGNVGRVCQVYGENLLLNQRVTKLKPKLPSSGHYVYWFFRQRGVHALAELISTGAAQQNLSPIKLGNQKVFIPNAALLEMFEEKVRPLSEVATMSRVVCQKLEQSRDMLLPRLISGKLSVENLDIQFPPGMEEPAHET